MKDKDWFENRDNIIDLFPKGFKKDIYDNSLFAQGIVTRLTSGTDVYEILRNLIINEINHRDEIKKLKDQING